MKHGTKTSAKTTTTKNVLVKKKNSKRHVKILNWSPNGYRFRSHPSTSYGYPNCPVEQLTPWSCAKEVEQEWYEPG